MFKKWLSRAQPSPAAALRADTKTTGAAMKAVTLGPSAHVDTFTRDRLPPPHLWPDIRLDRPEFQYPERLNAAVELTDRMVEKGFGNFHQLCCH